MFNTTLSDGSTRASIEGMNHDQSAYAGGLEDENADCLGIGGVLTPVMSLDEFVAEVDKTRHGNEEEDLPEDKEEEEEERWSEVSVESRAE